MLIRPRRAASNRKRIASVIGSAVSDGAAATRILTAVAASICCTNIGLLCRKLLAKHQCRSLQPIDFAYPLLQSGATRFASEIHHKCLKILERAKGIEPSTLSLGIRKKRKRIMIDFHYSRCVHSLECHRVGGEWK